MFEVLEPTKEEIIETNFEELSTFKLFRQYLNIYELLFSKPHQLKQLRQMINEKVMLVQKGVDNLSEEYRLKIIKYEDIHAYEDRRLTEYLEFSSTG